MEMTLFVYAGKGKHRFWRRESCDCMTIICNQPATLMVDYDWPRVDVSPDGKGNQTHHHCSLDHCKILGSSRKSSLYTKKLPLRNGESRAVVGNKRIYHEKKKKIIHLLPAYSVDGIHCLHRWRHSVGIKARGKHKSPTEWLLKAVTQFLQYARAHCQHPLLPTTTV